MRKTLILAVVAAGAFSSPVRADQIYRTNKLTTACKSDEALWSALHGTVSNECHSVPAGQEFESLNRQTGYFPNPRSQYEKMVYGRIWKAPDHKAEPEYVYFPASDVDGIVDNAGHPAFDECGSMPGGQVNRLEADKDGRIYLHSYMIQSQCVDGKAKTTVKRIR